MQNDVFPAMGARHRLLWYFSLTGSPLSPETLEKLKQNEYYAKGELLAEAYQ